MSDRKRTLRCAVYTRKSSEEGLEQDFNSLDAQREACEAYIASQKSEGWALLRGQYDDGGFSGGTLERPALQQLLADIEDSRVDVIVVYKIDRLSRSLMDFAKLVEVFDRKDVTFVSVTQAFNTTTSMGRLTLNILLSFAQFERELTGERIRDKIAASKKKGLWMGGFIPFGYDAHNRTLVINEPEAATVRTLFDLYLQHGTVPALEAEAARRGYVTRHRELGSGKSTGGRPFSRGHLYKILTNPLYIGEIEHKGTRYHGQHPAIIDQATWDAVQSRLRANTQGGKRTRANIKDPSLLAGLLFDDTGRRLIASHAVKSGRRYRYYASAPGDAGLEGSPAMRISAPEIEPVILHQVTSFLRQTTRLIDELGLQQQTPDSTKRIMEVAERLATELETTRGADQRAILGDLVGRVTVAADSLVIELNRVQVAARLLGDAQPDDSGTGQPVVVAVPLRVAHRGVETRLIIEGESASSRTPDPVLVRSIARGHAWFEDLVAGRASTIKQIADREGLTDRYVTRLLDLAFLPPALVEDILDGRQPADLTVEKLGQADLAWG